MERAVSRRGLLGVLEVWKRAGVLESLASVRVGVLGSKRAGGLKSKQAGVLASKRMADVYPRRSDHSRVRTRRILPRLVFVFRWFDHGGQLADFHSDS